MSDLDALLAGIVAHPTDALRWLVVADWLEDHGQPERAELVRVHRELLRTCTAKRETKARKQLHARMMELMRSGVQPCLPQKMLTLPGGVKLPMSFIPPGSFLMGSTKPEAADRSSDERRRPVTLTKGFWLGVTPVTQVQWMTVMGRNQSEFKGENLPLETVGWDDVRAFCGALKKRVGVEARLPTEAEWEYAARSGTTTPFHWGGKLNGMQASCDAEHPFGTEEKGPHLKMTTAVGSYAERSPHPWGLVDVIGNVWEWCADWHDSYPDGEALDPIGPAIGTERVYRGGSYNTTAWGCRAAYRGRNWPNFRCDHLGFRLAADGNSFE